MNRTSHWTLFRLVILLIWGVFVVVMTTQSESVPFVHWFAYRFAQTEFMATVGHARLTGFIYAGLSLRLSRRWALWLGIMLALLISTYTELFQILIADRDSSLTDLLANWLGIFIVGFLVASRNPALASPKLQRDHEKAV